MIYVWSTKTKDSKVHLAANISAENTYCDAKVPEKAQLSHEAPGDREACSKCLARFQ